MLFRPFINLVVKRINKKFIVVNNVLYKHSYCSIATSSSPSSLLTPQQQQLSSFVFLNKRFYCSDDTKKKDADGDGDGDGKGEVVDVDEFIKSKTTKRKPIVSKGVKLYPGFQQSDEELHSEILEKKFEYVEVDAKKIIEDFYGFNDLEYEKEDAIEKLTDEDKLKRDAKNAVFDVESVVKILRKENVKDICCINLDEEVNYANHLVLGSCQSGKHLEATYINFNKVFKFYRQEDDIFLNKCGKKSDKWLAIDTGNIVIHLFGPDQREYYDLESLWSVGPQYDDKYNEYLEEKREIEKRYDEIIFEDDSAQMK